SCSGRAKAARRAIRYGARYGIVIAMFPGGSFCTLKCSAASASFSGNEPRTAKNSGASFFRPSAVFRCFLLVLDAFRSEKTKLLGWRWRLVGIGRVRHLLGFLDQRQHTLEVGFHRRAQVRVAEHRRRVKE